MNIKNKGYATLQIFVVAFDFKVLLNNGIPPSKTMLRHCKIKAVIVIIKITFSLKKEMFLSLKLTFKVMA